MKHIRTIIALLFAGILINSQLSAQVQVTVVIKGFENNQGDLLMGVFNDPEQFPYEPFLEFAWPKDTISGNSLVADLSLPKPGKYAFSVLDDENASGDMDKNIIGFPKEHFGFSNGARPGFLKPPAYTDCLVEIRREENTVRIYLHRKMKEEE